MSQPVADGPTVRRELNRPPAEVWEQLTSPEGFEHWMGPGSTIEAEPDGELIVADPESGLPRIGRVIDVEPERRLQWVWRPLGDDPESGRATEVLIELRPDETGPGPEPGTLITVVERPTTRTVRPMGLPTAMAASVGCPS